MKSSTANQLSTQVMARQYRPHTFHELIGQEVISQTLKNAYSQNRLGHAYLLYGPRGVGKTSLARILSRLVNCTQPSEENEPCNVCSSCLEILEDKAMDILEIDAASHRGIHYIRELRENVQFQPMHAKCKVYIIDEVHMLTLDSFNALLKTLEEPPPYVMFILVTTEIQKIPATILSRCQTLRLRTISNADIQEYLRRLCKKLKREIDPEASLRITSLAKGSMRDMLSLFEQVYYFCGKKITLPEVEKLFGIVSEQIIFGLTKELFEKTDKVKEKSDQKDTSSSPLTQLIELLRNQPSVDFFVTFLWQWMNFFRILTDLKSNPKKFSHLQVTQNQVESYLSAFDKVYSEQIYTCYRHVYDLFLRTKSLPLQTHLELAILIEVEFYHLKEKIKRPTLGSIIKNMITCLENVATENSDIVKQPSVSPVSKKNIARTENKNNRNDQQQPSNIANNSQAKSHKPSMAYELQKAFQGQILSPKEMQQKFPEELS